METVDILIWILGLSEKGKKAPELTLLLGGMASLAQGATLLGAKVTGPSGPTTYSFGCPQPID